MAIPCNMASEIAGLIIRRHSIITATVLTGASFLTSCANSCASYLAAGKVAFSVGLMQTQALLANKAIVVCSTDAWAWPIMPQQAA